jgi:hypothetical protein
MATTLDWAILCSFLGAMLLISVLISVIGITIDILKDIRRDLTLIRCNSDGSMETLHSIESVLFQIEHNTEKNDEK